MRNYSITISINKQNRYYYEECHLFFFNMSCYYNAHILALVVHNVKSILFSCSLYKASRVFLFIAMATESTNLFMSTYGSGRK